MKKSYEALLTKRKDGRWQKVVGGKYYIDRDPERLLEKIKAAENPPPPSPPTFREVAEAWRKKHWEQITYKTISCYNSAYRRAVDADGDRLITDVTAGDIERILMRLKAQGLSAKTVKTQRTVYKLIFNYAIIDDNYGRFLKINPAVATSVPRGLPAEIREAPADDVIEIIRHSYGKYFGLFPFLLLYTGFRRGEALALTWGDIDFKNKIIKCSKAVTLVGGMPYLKPPKTEAGIREVPLLSDLEKVLVRPADAKDEDLVFPSASKKHLAEVTYNKRWMHYCKDTGLVQTTTEERISKQGKKYVYTKYKPTITAHPLRHGYATILFEAGVDVYTAQRLLGHANVETTMAIYTHLREKQQAKSTAKLQEYLNANYKPI